MIEFLESLGFLIELTVMDNEYYQQWIFKYLEGKNITYIVSVRESERLKGMNEAALKYPKDRVQIYGMKDGYVKGKSYQDLEFKVVFYGRRTLISEN